ncbi:unnamed protein product [Tilletia controversa]|uniref:Uncharacterized protein n=1 Tax=Tilletia caries TaxID=13290 RepID=A0A8T8SLN5_9BASI|nr:hypothetical protein CF336_g2275 [Tilletia laevis]KAE8202505.1 hypothetical protein CF335_g3387 [Tilletia laevis]KAE8243734.1 hypothetical protein A4X03_0g7686 [Tilletia caries]CAD6968455.1 unnamed protein product [Tilletia controversa]
MPFSALPGEIILQIATQALIPDEPAKEDLCSLCRRACELRLISPRFNMAVPFVLSQHFHTYQLVHERPIRANLPTWIPSLRDPPGVHHLYWFLHQGVRHNNLPDLRKLSDTLQIAKLPKLKSTSLDLRLKDLPISNTTRMWNDLHVPQWIQVTTTLSKMLAVCSTLEELNLRVPPQQDIINIVENSSPTTSLSARFTSR